MVSRDAPNATAARCLLSAGTSPANPRPTPPGPTPSFATPPRRTTARRSYPLRPAAVASTLVALLSSTQRTSPSVTATSVMRCGGGASDDTPAASASTVNRSGAAACARRSAAPAFSALCAPTAVRGARSTTETSSGSSRGRRIVALFASWSTTTPGSAPSRTKSPPIFDAFDPLDASAMTLSLARVNISAPTTFQSVRAFAARPSAPPGPGPGPVAAPPRGSAANEPSPRTHANALAFAAAYASTLPWRST